MITGTVIDAQVVLGVQRRDPRHALDELEARGTIHELLVQRHARCQCQQRRHERRPARQARTGIP
jgi:hypothetical protein